MYMLMKQLFIHQILNEIVLTISMRYYPHFMNQELARFHKRLGSESAQISLGKFFFAYQAIVTMAIATRC